MNNSIPLVSIIMNCYNGEKYLNEAIDSIYSQTYENWEIIFWDNCSTDNSSKIALSYDKKLNYYKSEKNVNLGYARKLAICKAKGEWLAFLDTDDYWFPNKLEKQIDAIINSDFIVCYAGIRDINEYGEFIRDWYPRYESGDHLKRQLEQFDINMVTPIIKKQVLDQYGITFDKNIIASEEYNLFIRLAAKGKFCTINEILGVWRILENSLTNKSISYWWKDQIYTLEQLKEENLDIINNYENEINKALSKAMYYKVRWLMSENKTKEARKTMYSISFDSMIYFILFLCSYIVPLWNFIHDEKIKRKLSSKMFSFFDRCKKLK